MRKAHRETLGPTSVAKYANELKAIFNAPQENNSKKMSSTSLRARHPGWAVYHQVHPKPTKKTTAVVGGQSTEAQSQDAPKTRSVLQTRRGITQPYVQEPERVLGADETLNPGTAPTKLCAAMGLEEAALPERLSPLL